MPNYDAKRHREQMALKHIEVALALLSTVEWWHVENDKPIYRNERREDRTFGVLQFVCVKDCDRARNANAS